MKKLFNALLFVGLVAGAVLAAVQYLVFTPEAVTAEVLRQLRRGFTGFVKLGGARVHALSSISLTDLTLSDPSATTTFVSLKNASLSLDWRGLLGGRIRFSELNIDGLELVLQRGADGRFTFEQYLPRKTASLPRVPRFPVEWLAAAAGDADGVTVKEEGDAVAIDRVYIRESRVNYLDAYVPIQIHHIQGTLKLDPGQLEILTLRGRAFDRFPVSIDGTMAIPGPTHRFNVRLDDGPLKALISFIPPLSLLLQISREQLEGGIGVSATTHADPHEVGTEVSLKFREMRWTSRLLGATITAPKAEVAFSTRGVGSGIRVDGSVVFEQPLVRPSSFTQDVPCEEVRLAFDSNASFARLRSYSAKLRSGTLSGVGYASWGAARPDFQMSFNLDRVPLAELGLAGPDSAAMARDMVLTLKGRFLPGWVQVTQGELALGASKVSGSGALVPDGMTWALRDAPATVELDAADLSKLLGIGSSVKMSGKLAGQMKLGGPIGQLKGEGRLAAARVTLAPIAGGEPFAVDLEDANVELQGNQLTLPQLTGAILGGRMRSQIAISTQPLSPTGARMNFEIVDADVVALAKVLGGAGQVQSGRIGLAGLVGSRLNVGETPPPPESRSAGASAPVTGSAGTAGTTAPAGPYGLTGRERPSGRPSFAEASLPQGILFTGNLEVRDLVAPLPASLRPGATRGSPNELKLDHGTAHMSWENDALNFSSIVGQGAAGELTGTMRLEGPGRVSGKIALASADGRVAVDLPFQAAR